MPPLRLDGSDYVREKLKLMLCVRPAVLARLVGHCEMREDALRLKARQPARLHDPVDAMLEIIAVTDVAES